MPYSVIVADNFHYQDEDEEHELGSFETATEALAAAKRIVDQSLARAFRPGMSAEALYQAYVDFGEDPYIRATGNEPKAAFSAWDYARTRAGEIVAGR